jgi:cytolethal distending toxin subunit A
MAHIFDITAPGDAVSLGPSGTGEIPFTVTNVGASAVRGRAVLGPEKSAVLSWLKLAGEQERLLQPKQTDTFLVKVAVPPGTNAGDYSFRLDIVSVARPDEDSTQGPAIKIPVILAPPPPKPFPWWILAVAAVVIGGLSYAAIKLIPGNKAPVQTAIAKPAPPARIAPPAGRAAIRNLNSSLCLSPAGGLSDRNGAIGEQSCDGNVARSWTFQAVQGDVVKIQNSARPPLCLTVAGGNTVPADPAVQFTCDEDPSRRWHFVALDDTKFQLENVNSNMCLVVDTNATTANNIVQKPCNPLDRWQVWEAILAP